MPVNGQFWEEKIGKLEHRRNVGQENRGEMHVAKNKLSNILVIQWEISFEMEKIQDRGLLSESQTIYLEEI